MPDRQVQPLSVEKERGRKTLFHFDRRGRVDAHALQIAANVVRRLPDALFVLDHSDAHEAFAVLTITDARRDRYARRSEDHTSELQSLMPNSYAVYCLKKKTHISSTHITPNT